MYRDIVECIKLNQIRQGVAGKTLALRIGVHPQVLTEIRGYRLKVSSSLFEKIIAELSIQDLTEEEKQSLLKNQEIAKWNKHRKYIKDRDRRTQ